MKTISSKTFYLLAAVETSWRWDDPRYLDCSKDIQISHLSLQSEHIPALNALHKELV